MATRLAHLRDAMTGASGRAWAGAAQITPGPTRTFQIQEVPEHTLDPEVTRAGTLGTDYTDAVYVVEKPAPVRPSNLGSFFVSDPGPFQSYFKVHWEDMFGASANLKQGARRLTPLPNPNAPGKAEGQAIQQFNPWPSASQLNPSYPGAELKAI